MSKTYGEDWHTIGHLYDGMAIRTSREHEFTQIALKAIANKMIYQVIETATGVPWPLIAALHKREADMNFNAYLGNGDNFHRRTVHVPSGRGPFNSFTAGAIDALRYDGLSHVKDWTLEKMLYYAEKFNGWGYSNHGIPSPYVWGGTNNQKPGKYVRDGVWSSSAFDGQPGVAPILHEIAKYSKDDQSVKYVRET